MLVLLEIGRRLGVRRLARDPEGANLGTSAVDGAVYALLGLLIAFTFSGAALRFDERRNLIVQGGNDIGTAYLSISSPHCATGVEGPVSALCGFSPGGLSEVVRRRSTQSGAGPFREVAGRDLEHGRRSGRMEGAQPAATNLLLKALNQMIDITNTRTIAIQMHLPLLSTDCCSLSQW